MERYVRDKFVSWDIGGPLRNSEDSMGHAIKTAAAEAGKRYEVTLDNGLLWRLWSIKGSNFDGSDEKAKFEGQGGDYMAWFYAAYALESVARDMGISPDEVCRKLFSNEDPYKVVAEVVQRYAPDKAVCVPIGQRAIHLFGKDPKTIAKSRPNDGSIEAVHALYIHDILMGIVSSAPTPESTIVWANNAVRGPLVAQGKVSPDTELFHPKVVRYGKAKKVEHLEQSVLAAAEILGNEPETVWYLADTNDDITDTAEANRRLISAGRKSRISLAMIRKGMGLPNMWKKAWTEAGLEVGNGYFEFEDAHEAAMHIIK